jgi:hypothetical protein
MGQRLMRIWRDDRTDDVWIVRWAGPQTLSLTLNAPGAGSIQRHVVPCAIDRPLADFSDEDLRAVLDVARTARR